MEFYSLISSSKRWDTEKIITRCFGNDTELNAFIDVALKQKFLKKSDGTGANMDFLFDMLIQLLPYLDEYSSVYPARP